MGELINLDDYRAVKEEAQEDISEQEANWIMQQILTQVVFHIRKEKAQQMIDEIMSQIEFQEE